MLSAQELLLKAAPKTRETLVQLPDGTKEKILVKGLNGKEASQEIEYMQTLTDENGDFIPANTQLFYAHCVANRLVDEQGNKILTQEQCESMDNKWLEALFKAAYEEVGAKNSPKK